MNKTAQPDNPGPDRAHGDLPATARSLPIALIRARERVMAPIRQMLSDSGITEQQWRILRVLSEHGPQDATKLADRACLLLPSQTRIVQSMLGKGYLARATDTQDRRRQTLSITAKGQQAIDDNLDRAVEIAASYKAALGAADYEKLLDLLEALDGS